MRLALNALTAFFMILLVLVPAARAASEPVSAPNETASGGEERTLRRQALSVLADASANQESDGALRREAMAKLATAARAGDYFALIALERKRREGDPAALTLREIVEIEIELAERGDAVTAWRLAQRYETGEGAPHSIEEMIRWLRVAGGAADFPKARDAAFRLCEIYGGRGGGPDDLDEARAWCARAAARGHAGAAIVMARLRDVES